MQWQIEAMGYLLHLWNEWAAQILVLVSFTLQVVLLLFAGIPRRSVSNLPRNFIMLTCLLADTTSTYALCRMASDIGNLSSSSGSSKHHQLVAFWAPFLLLHFGGQDAVTMFNLDNKYWPCHLLIFVVNALGAKDVLYKYMAGGGLLVPAAILVYLAGVLRNGERICALKRINMDSLRCSIRKEDAKDFSSGDSLDQGLLDHNMDSEKQYENIVLVAHSLFKIFRRPFMDLTIGWEVWHPLNFVCLHRVKAESIYRVVEMELSLMYDVLYTKAVMIHTWYGHCIHIMSLLVIVAALVLFQASSRDGYRRVDVVVTYVLLVGASALEVVSVFQAIVSTWTCAFLNAWKWHRLLRVVLYLLRLVQTKRRWSNSIGQCNLIYMCTHDMLENDNCGFVDASSDLKEMILKELKETAMEKTAMDFRSCRGRWALQRRSLSSQLGWSVDMDFDDSILVWHIATDIFICCCDKVEVETAGPLCEAVKVLSNYMMFIHVTHPNMLPEPARYIRYVRAYYDMKDYLEVCPKEDIGRSRFSFDVEDAMKRRYFSRPDQSAVIAGAGLAKQLVGMELELSEKLEVIASVWVEMLCYAANNSTGNFHANRLSCGSELVTIVWLLMAHLGLEGHLEGYPLGYRIDDWHHFGNL